MNQQTSTFVYGVIAALIALFVLDQIKKISNQ